MINQDIEADNIKRQWVDFFDRYDYNDQINKLRSDYPEVKSLYISYNDLSGYSSEFIEGLMKDPYYYLTIGEFYISDYTHITVYAQLLLVIFYFLFLIYFFLWTLKQLDYKLT